MARKHQAEDTEVGILDVAVLAAERHTLADVASALSLSGAQLAHSNWTLGTFPSLG